jgi:hypothetical protein
MNELFSNPQRPFYRSAHLIKLSKISREEYSAFIIKQFQNHKKKITTEISEQILEWCDDHTYFVQYLCNRLFANSTEKLVAEQDWKTQASMLLEEQQSIFFTFRNMLTEDQWKLFKAIAKEGKTFAPTSQKFIKKYKLKSSASILRAIKSLLNSELIFMDFDNDGKQYYCVYDLFFRRWSENR